MAGKVMLTRHSQLSGCGATFLRTVVAHDVLLSFNTYIFFFFLSGNSPKPKSSLPYPRRQESASDMVRQGALRVKTAHDHTEIAGTSWPGDWSTWLACTWQSARTWPRHRQQTSSCLFVTSVCVEGLLLETEHPRDKERQKLMVT